MKVLAAQMKGLLDQKRTGRRIEKCYPDLASQIGVLEFEKVQRVIFFLQAWYAARQDRRSQS